MSERPQSPEELRALSKRCEVEEPSRDLDLALTLAIEPHIGDIASAAWIPEAPNTLQVKTADGHLSVEDGRLVPDFGNDLAHVHRLLPRHEFLDARIDRVDGRRHCILHLPSFPWMVGKKAQTDSLALCAVLTELKAQEIERKLTRRRKPTVEQRTEPAGT